MIRLCYDFCICCSKVTTMNSAGRTMASFTVTSIFPSRISRLVMVLPRPICTSNASSREEPANAPCFHFSVRKLTIILLTVTQVFASFGSNTYALSAALIDCSNMIIVLLTLIYLQSRLLPSRVLAPQTSVPIPGNVLMALIDLPEMALTFRSSCSSCVMLTAGLITLFRLTLAGDPHASIVVHHGINTSHGSGGRQ